VSRILSALDWRLKTPHPKHKSSSGGFPSELFYAFLKLSTPEVLFLIIKSLISSTSIRPFQAPDTQNLTISGKKELVYE